VEQRRAARSTECCDRLVLALKMRFKNQPKHPAVEAAHSESPRHGAANEEA